MENSVLSKNKRFWPVYKLNETIISQKNYPTSFVVIETMNVNIFTMVLDGIRNSIWWNHAACYLVVNRNSEPSCQMVATFSNIFWSYNIVSGLYLCKKENNDIAVYTFNPYSNIAPKFWRLKYRLLVLIANIGHYSNIL